MIKHISTIFTVLFTLSITSVSYADKSTIDTLIAKQPGDKPVFAEREKSEKAVLSNPFAIAFYKPTYILPFYFTMSPDQDVYGSNTPNGQKIQSQEFKAQFSFKVPLWHNILGTDTQLNAAYTQQMYWQVYAKSQYFRETNYQPEIFLTKKVTPNLWVNPGIEHQSNGRGGSMERSWNRAYVDAIYSRNDFAVSLRPWILLFKSTSSSLDNDGIERYMGHGELIFSYKWRKLNLNLTTRNNFESGFRRGTNEFDCSFPITTKVKLYMQLFSGYGQSLIEYNHYTNAIGVGIALSDWI